MRHRSTSAQLARATTAALAANFGMVGPPGSGGSGLRRDGIGASSSTTNGVNTSRNGIASTKASTGGRMTPARALTSENNARTGWGFETPTNKILNNVPTTITNRSSERRRRIKTDGADVPGPNEKPILGSGFVDSRFARVRTPTFDVSPRSRERSDSNASAKSENTPQPRRLAKVSSFTSDRPSSTPLQPTNRKDNFFHANDRPERPPSRESAENFFFAANKVKNVPSSTMLNLQPRRLSNGSQYSSFSTAKEATQRTTNTTQNSLPKSAPISQPRTPTSPTRPAFFHISGTAPPSPTFSKQNSPPSPLRMAFTANPIQKLVSQSLFPQPPPASSSSSDSTTPDLPTDTSEEELGSIAKPLLSKTADLEDAARINRKVHFHVDDVDIDRGSRNLKC